MELRKIAHDFLNPINKPVLFKTVFIYFLSVCLILTQNTVLANEQNSRNRHLPVEIGDNQKEYNFDIYNTGSPISDQVYGSVSTVETNTSLKMRSVFNEIEKDILNIRQNAEINFASVEKDKKTIFKNFESLKQKISDFEKRYSDKNAENYRITFSVVKFFMSGGGLVVSLVISDLPANTLNAFNLSMAFLTAGTLSGIVMLHNQQLGSWLVKQTKTLNWVTDKVKNKSVEILNKKVYMKEISEQVSAYSRWYLLEFGFIQTIQFVNFMTGVSPEYGLSKIIEYSLLATAAIPTQGSWEAGFVLKRNREIESNNLTSSYSKYKMDRSSLIVSSISTAMILAHANGIDTTYGLVTLGLLGVVNFMNEARKSQPFCHKLFR